MTSFYEPQVGDIVTVKGTIIHVHGDCVTFSTASGADECVWTKNITLVERPEPKITIELTKSGLVALWSRSLSHLPDSDFDAIYTAIEELGL